MGVEVYREEQTRRVLRYVAEEYGVEPEFMWPERYPTYAVLRNGRNGKWFGLVTTVSGKSLGMETGEVVEAVVLRFDAGQALEFAAETEGVWPGYHMNKKNWISVVLDESMADEKVFGLVDRSWRLVEGE